MRLDEISSDDFIPKDSIFGKYKRIGRLKKIPGTQDPSGGRHSRILDVPGTKRLNQVVKVASTGPIQTMKDAKDISEDGYLSYIKAVYDYEQKGGQNPYFPRIHNLKIYKNNGKISYRANIEKLIKYADLNDKLTLMSLSEHMFFVVTPQIAVVIELAIETGIYNNIKDEKLIEAIKMIRKIIDSYEPFYNDATSYNLMWRITGNMPQLVILDPIG